MPRRPFKSGSENIWASALQGALQGFNTRQQMEQMAAEREVKRQAADIASRAQKVSEAELQLKGLLAGQGSSVMLPSGQTQNIPGLQGVNYDPENIRFNVGPNFSSGIKPGAVKVPPVAGSMMPGERAVDQAFGKEYADYVAGGGSSEVKKNIQQLDSVIGKLETGEVKTGVLPGMLAKLPGKNQAALENVQQTVQTNLRQVLGPQFTAKEGEGILNRAYNPLQPISENIARLNRLSKQIKEAAAAKAQAVDYFEKNGTLSGFKGKLYTSADQFLADNPVTSTKSQGAKSVNSQAEYDALPVGAEYVDSQGNRGVKR